MRPLPTQLIVPGDIIRLKSGDKIPADCRIIYNQSLKVDQAMITGESEPVDSTVIAASHEALEAKNIIFNGSLCVDGGCFAVAIRTGKRKIHILSYVSHRMYMILISRRCNFDRNYGLLDR
jgi:P-type E1-E2 ATPase